jgi:hypothetical protein
MPGSGRRMPTCVGGGPGMTTLLVAYLTVKPATASLA